METDSITFPSAQTAVAIATLQKIKKGPHAKHGSKINCSGHIHNLDDQMSSICPRLLKAEGKDMMNGVFDMMNGIFDSSKSKLCFYKMCLLTAFWAHPGFRRYMPHQFIHMR
jgi:hypothetical protein